MGLVQCFHLALIISLSSSHLASIGPLHIAPRWPFHQCSGQRVRACARGCHTASVRMLLADARSGWLVSPPGGVVSPARAARSRAVLMQAFDEKMWNEYANPETYEG